MADLTISAAVGAPPALNRPDDVRTVQTLLQKFKPPTSVTVSATGTLDSHTRQAIRDVQKRFMQHPDGRVDPGGRTLMHLNEGSVSHYLDCDPKSRLRIDQYVRQARNWLDIVNRRLASTGDVDMQKKVKNIFNIDPASRTDAGSFQRLKANCLRLRQSLDEQLTFRCVPKTNMNAAWVRGTDPTINLPLNFFTKQPAVAIAKIIHERSHTVLNIGHSGMPQGGAIDFGEAPDDPKKYTFEQAINNSWCYEYLVTALQPDYDAAKAREL